MTAITVQTNPFSWKDRALSTAIDTFKNMTAGEKDSERRIKAFADMRRDNGTFFFSDAQKNTLLSSEATTNLKSNVDSKASFATPSIFKITELVGEMFSGLSVKEIARAAHVHSTFRDEGFQAIIKQLMTKESYTWKELNDCKRALGLASFKELMTLFPVMSSKIQNLDLSDHKINSRQFGQIIKFFPHLTSVNLAGCPHLTDAAIRELADKCPNLTSVNCAGCPNLTVAAIREVADKCPNLTSVNFAGCKKLTDTAIGALADKCAHLTSICLGSCDNLTDAAVMAVADSKCAAHLTSINFENCPKLTDTAVSELVDKCAHLASINFGGCNNLTDAAVMAVADSKCAAHLTSLDFGFCENLTDAAVMAVADSKCTDHLTSVDFGFCKNLTDAAVKKLVDKCAYLTSMNFVNCGQLTDIAVMSLASSKCAAHLTSINFGWCHNLTDAAVRALARCCFKLTSISDSTNHRLQFERYRKEFAYIPNVTQ